jgi:hypothetical protein
MPVNRGRARVHPKARRLRQFANGFAEQTGRLYPGFFDRFAVGVGVTAIHAASSQIDEDVDLFQTRHPRSEHCSIPLHCLPGPGLDCPGQHDNPMPLAVEISREKVPDLSIAARENNAKRPTHGIVSAVASSAYIVSSKSVAIFRIGRSNANPESLIKLLTIETVFSNNCVVFICRGDPS